MKTGVVAILIFVAAFIITTAALIYFNTQFKNIFKFDFSPVNHGAATMAIADSTAQKQAESAKPDSSKALDSLKNIAKDLAPKKDSVNTALTSENKQENKIPNNSQPAVENQANTQNTASAVKTADVNSVKNEIKNADIKKMDPVTYEKWKKSTAGIIEAMDANKASQVLRMYADNIGGELLYSMKKKKAAEILSKFDSKKDSLIIRQLTRIR